MATSRTGDAQTGVYVAKRLARWAIGGNEALLAALASRIVRITMRRGGGAVPIVGAERAASDGEIAQVLPEAVGVRSARCARSAPIAERRGHRTPRGVRARGDADARAGITRG